MQKISALLILSLLFGCKTLSGPKEVLGQVELSDLAKDSSCGWLPVQIGHYKADPSVLNQMSRLDYTGYSWRVYLGCWCSDSKKLVPPFLDIMQAINFPKERIQFYALDLNKQAPGNAEEQDSIRYVPTFILYKDHVEQGRIVESVDVPLESALWLLLAP